MKLPNVIKYLFPIFLLFSFILLSKYEDRAMVKRIDFAATVKLQDKIDKSAHLRLASLVDNIMEGSTFFAEPLFTSLVVLVLTILAFRKYKWKALGIPLAFAFIALVEVYGKTVVHHPSPPFGMIKHPTSIFPSNYINEQFSYPSGHAARAVFIAILAWWLSKKKFWMTALLALYICLVAVSKMYLGQHWLSDVIGGWLLGSGFAMGLLQAI